MPTFTLAIVLPFNSTGCGILPTFGGSPPFSGAKVPQPVLLNDLHIIKAVQNRVYSCLQLLPASTRFCFPSIPVGTAWRGITRVRKMQAFPNALRVLPQRHRIPGNAAVVVNGLHGHLPHRPSKSTLDRRVLPQRHRILGNAAVAVNGLHVHLRHRPY